MKRRHGYLQDIQINDGSLSGVFPVKEDLRIFRSHFEGNPILPGVVQGQMLENAGTFLLEEKYPNVAASEYSNLKFKNPIRPGVTLKTESVIQSIDENTASVSGTIKNNEDGTVYAQGKMKFLLNGGPSIPTCESLPAKDVRMTQQEIADYIPHGDDIRFCDEINEVRWCETTTRMMENGQRREILFPDMVGSKVFSRVFVGEDRFLLDYYNDQLVLPFSNHVEIAAQTGIFIIWGIKPDDVDIETILLGYSGEVINPMPAGTMVECWVHLTQSRGNPQKGYMNFFEAEISSGDIVFSKIKYSAICNYIDRSAQS